jgi:hypothetical protein
MYLFRLISALETLGSMRNSDDPAILNDRVSVQERLYEPQSPGSAKVLGDPLPSLLVHEENIGPVMARASPLALEQFDRQRRNTALLAAANGMAGHHLASPLRIVCNMDAIAASNFFASR